MFDVTFKQVEEQMMENIRHISVMKEEVLEYLALKPGSCILDCTVGLGGHGAAILEAIGPDGRYIGLDRDMESLNIARERLSKFSARYDLVKSDYRNFDKALDDLGVDQVDGILFDLGISSYQIDNPDRGFSIRQDGPLDMRMDQNSYISAYDLVNSLSEFEISKILKTFGEERWHHRIAHHLVIQRQKSPISSTVELSDAILKSIPHRFKRQKIHPATRTFQALRIAVNRELEALEVALDKVLPYIRKGGRICVLAFHSLEDRIVKHKLRQFAKEGKIELVFKKPLRPKQEETVKNIRSRSARLRIGEKL